MDWNEWANDDSQPGGRRFKQRATGARAEQMPTSRVLAANSQSSEAQSYHMHLLLSTLMLLAGLVIANLH